MSAAEEFLANISLTAKSLAGTFAGTYLVQLVFPSMKNVLGLVPGKAIVAPWTFLTSGLVQDNFVGLVVYTAAALFLSRPIETVHGSTGLLKFLAIALAGSAVLTFFLVTAVYYILTVAGAERAGDYLYDPICGFQGGLAALLVGVKQAIGDSEITMFRVIHFQAKHAPAFYLLTMIAMGVVTGSTLKLVPFVGFATYVAWFYLRFFAYRLDSFLKGEPSAEFRFASFFPTLLQPVADEVARVCSAVTRIGTDLGSEAEQAQRTNVALLGRATPSKDNFEAARRRERGVRALEERLGAVKPMDLTQQAKQQPLQPELQPMLNVVDEPKEAQEV